MELFIKVVFWMGLLSGVLRLLIISLTKEYPRVDKATLGSDLVKFIEGAIFVTWAAFLLFK